MSRRSWWIAVFLTVTALAVGGELWAAFDDSPDTVPWTDLILDLPVPVWALAVAALVVWLPIHLVVYYRRRARKIGRHKEAHRVQGP
jgi:ribose/xylose/arabinose/galactoside ABC-type transport system permease subunit